MKDKPPVTRVNWCGSFLKLSFNHMAVRYCKSKGSVVGIV